LTLHFIARRTEMRLQISIFALSAALCASAFAADLPVRTNAPAPMPVFVSANWTGFYLGANVGYAWADASLRNSGPPGPPARTVGADSDGVIGGLQAGYDWQMGSLVLGFVADVSLADLKGSFVNVPPPGPPFTATASVNWMATLRARAGMLLTPNFLAYVHGGVAFAGVEGNWVGGPWNGSGDKTRTGWVAGGGLEYKWTQNLSAFTEYSYADFGSYSFANVGGPAVRFDNDIRVQTIKVGFNYRFGGPAGAVVARY
jgi:outer membrane immunogenic protein